MTGVKVLSCIIIECNISFAGANVSGSPVSLGVLSARAGGGARCAGTGLAHAHVGKEAAFTIHAADDAPPVVQVQ